MSINLDDAFEIDEEGMALVDNDGNAIGYFTSIAGDPTGSSAPLNTWVFRQDTQTIYYKFGAGDNDWRQVRADDIAFDDSLAENLAATNLKQAVDSLANRHYGKDFVVESKVNSETTSGGSFASYDTLNFDVTAEGATNKYRLNADFLWGHNSASNDIRIRVLLDGAQIGEELRIEPKDPGSDQRFQNNIMVFAENLTPGTHSFTLQYRPATASRVSSMYRSELEVWRVE